MSKLLPNEVEIKGHWSSVDGKVEADANCSRIDDLINNQLIEIARDSSGWELLYRDPDDGRLWELTFPQGNLQGAGPPRLLMLSPQEANSKFEILR